MAWICYSTPPLRSDTSCEPGFPQIDELDPETIVALPSVLNMAALRACNEGETRLAADMILFAARLQAALLARERERSMPQ